MIITYNGLCELVEQGVIQNVPHENINSASIDLTLGGEFFYEDVESAFSEINIGNKEVPFLVKGSGRMVLEPGDFCLASTQQIFNLPNDICAIYVLKSSMARAGLNHLNAGYCDPGWNGSALTMEFHNTLRYHTIVMEEGSKCGQMYFMRGEMVPDLASYAVRGNYNGDKGTQQSKGVR